MFFKLLPRDGAKIGRQLWRHLLFCRGARCQTSMFTMPPSTLSKRRFPLAVVQGQLAGFNLFGLTRHGVPQLCLVSHAFRGEFVGIHFLTDILTWNCSWRCNLGFHQLLNLKTMTITHAHPSHKHVFSTVNQHYYS